MEITYNGLGSHLGNLARLSRAQTRSISAENITGEKGKGGMATEGTGADSARELGQGWKVSPSIHIPGDTTVTLAEIDIITDTVAIAVAGRVIALADVGAIDHPVSIGIGQLARVVRRTRAIVVLAVANFRVSGEVIEVRIVAVRAVDRRVGVT